MDSGTKRDVPALSEVVSSTTTTVVRERELDGVVRGGVVQFVGESLPDGTLVKVRPGKP